VLLDIETTGGSARHSRITEIGALRIENGSVADTFQTLINPGEEVPAYITKITGITTDMVWTAPPFAAIASKLEDFLDGALFIAHFVQFDYSFIQAEFERIGITFRSDRACSVKLSRLLHPEQGRHGLDQVIERLGIAVENRHRAYDDAAVIWRFIQDEYEKDALRLFRNLARVTTYTR
jgi:DNA polymerase-3 subunit epsilon